MAMYAIQGAKVSCSYGNGTGQVQPRSDRHVNLGTKLIGNAWDFQHSNVFGFGVCRSQYRSDLSALQMRGDGSIKNVQQLAAKKTITEGDGLAVCQYAPLFLWQGVSPDVMIGKANALMEDSWIMCACGLGFLSIVDPGQEAFDSVRQMMEKLAQLEAAVDSYMKANGIKAKHKDSLMESILLWNGYDNIPWNYKSNERNRAFCSYLEKENPLLFNYFERGLYLGGYGDDRIDLSYMMGIYKALGQANHKWKLVNMEMVNDQGMYNAYLEACRMEPDQSLSEAMASFLEHYKSPDYDPQARYDDYASSPTEEKRQIYCSIYKDPEEVCIQETNLSILQMGIEGRTDKDTSKAFIDKLRGDVK